MSRIIGIDLGTTNSALAYIDVQRAAKTGHVEIKPFPIPQLVAAGEIPAGFAVEALIGAANRLRSFDTHRPWRAPELDKIVRLAFADGLARPRRPEGAP